MEVADSDSQQTSIERAATSANALISNYILAKLLGTSPTRLPTGHILPPNTPLDGVPRLPFAPFPVVPDAYVEDDGRMIASELDMNIAVASNRSTDDGENSDVEKTRPVDVPSIHHHRHHQPDATAAEELLLEWKGDRGQARSVSNAANNFVVFAPLSPGHVVRKPEVVLPTATSVTFQSSPPSTSPASSLRLVVEKSLGKRRDDTRFDYTALIRKDIVPVTANDKTGNSSTVELDEFKSGPAAADMVDEHEEDIGFIAQDQDYVTPVTGFHLRPRLFPRTTQPRDVSNEAARAASVSLLLPPDNVPWTISEDPELTAHDREPIAPKRQLSVVIDNQSEHDHDHTIHTRGSHESTKATPTRDSDSNVATTTTDPTIYMYTVLSAASRRSGDDTDDVGDDVRNDVGLDDENDVKAGITDDVGEVVRESQESKLTEVGSDDDTLRAVIQDTRRLSPEFLRVIQSLWPGLEICAGPQCSIEDATRPTDVLASSPDVDNGVTVSASTRRSTKHDFPTANAWKLKSAVSGSKRAGKYKDVDDSTVLTESLTTTTISTDDVTSQPATTRSLRQMLGSSAPKTDSTTASLRHTLSEKLIDNITAYQLTVTRRKDIRPNNTVAVDNDIKMSSGGDRPERSEIIATLSPTASDVQLVDSVYDGESPRRRQLSTLSSIRSINTRRNKPATNVPRTRRLNGPIRRLIRPFYLHPVRTDPIRREKSYEHKKQQPFRQRHGFSPANFPSSRSPTIIRPHSDLRGLTGKRRAKIVDRDSELVRSRDSTLQKNEETRLGSAFNVAIRRTQVEPPRSRLSRDRTVMLASEGGDHKELLKKTTTSTLTGIPMDGIRIDDISPSKMIIDGRNAEIAGLKQIRDMLDSQSLSEKDQRKETTGQQTTYSSNKPASSSRRLSKTDREQKVRDGGNKTAQKKFTDDNRTAVIESVTRGRSSTRGELTTASSTKALHGKPTESQRQAMSDDIEEALTSKSNPTNASDQLQTTANRLLVVESVEMSPSPGSSELLPVHASPGEDERSAAAIAMLGGYADWMVGLISAVAVAVFIFLAILSFLAVVSCRCVSTR